MIPYRSAQPDVPIMETRPALRERRSVADRMIEKIKAFVEAFVEGVD